MQEKLTDLFNAVSENNIRQKTQDYNRAIETLEGSFKSLSQQMEAGKGSIGSMADSLRGTSTDLQKVKKDLNDAAQSARYNLENAVSQITKDYIQEVKKLEDSFKSLSQQMDAGKASVGSMTDSLRGTSTDLQKIKKDLNDAAGSAGKNIGDIPADLDKVQQTLQAQSLRLEECLKQLSEGAARLPSVSASQAETLETLEKLKKLLKENGGKQGDAPDGPQSNGSASQKQE